MKRKHWYLPFLLILVLLAVPVQAQEDGRAAELYALVNDARLDEGLPPYAWSGALATSAQRHADDMAANELSSHTGSDGSTYAERIAEAGYVAWGEGEVVGENFWVGSGTAQDALDWFMDDLPHRENILSDRYREVGVGVATDAEGRSYYVLDLGARPNVLPVFINDGAEIAESSQVAVRLTNEEAYPNGRGTNYMGRAIEFRISNEPDFDELPWQSWEPLVAWTLPEEDGEHTIFLQFRDGAGRTAASADSIVLQLGEGSPVPSRTSSPVPPSPAPTSVPTQTTATAPLPTEAQPTASPEAGTAVSPAPRPSPTPVRAGDVTSTPFPTWTPLPDAAATVTPDGSRAALGLVCGLQIVAILLGFYLALRRRSG